MAHAHVLIVHDVESVLVNDLELTLVTVVQHILENVASSPVEQLPFHVGIKVEPVNVMVRRWQSRYGWGLWGSKENQGSVDI